MKTGDRKRRYPEDFDLKGLPLRTRKGRGLPALVENLNGDTCYAVVYGATQLHGQEGHDSNESEQDEETNNPAASIITIGDDEDEGSGANEGQESIALRNIARLSSDVEEIEPHNSESIASAAHHIDKSDKITVESLTLMKDAMRVIRGLCSLMPKSTLDTLDGRYAELRNSLTTARAVVNPDLHRAVQRKQAGGR
ncbi:hypothetical protein MMC22_009006 [Lobaria immixta]|nr:hypothetical protein [Lobaria immixta]